MTAAKFFTDSEMLNLQGLVTPGYQTEITILRLTINTDDTDPQNAFGTDAYTYVPGTTIKGWFYSTPTPTITEVGGIQATLNLYRLFVPVGTKVSPGDRLIAESNTYVVEDTIEESTWLPLLRCSLRRLE